MILFVSYKNSHINVMCVFSMHIYVIRLYHSLFIVGPKQDGPSSQNYD